MHSKSKAKVNSRHQLTGSKEAEEEEEDQP